MKKVIYLSGGLGNQFFQMLFAIHLSKLNNNVFVDTSLIENNLITEKLLRWNVHGDFVTEIFKKKFELGRRSKVLVCYDLMFLYISRSLKTRFFSHKYLHTKENKVDNNAKIIMGYFQNMNIYSDIQLKSYLTIFENFISRQKLKNRTVIHFRGGDSNWAKEHSSYYIKVFNLVQKNNLCVDIVTDDKLRCKKLLKSYDFEYSIISKDALSDFEYLSHSTTIFTAPSTYSWWAAILNNDKKKIYMPYFFKERFVVNSKIIYL